MNKSIAMVFDVETTGLLYLRHGTVPKLEECPYVLQCSYILYDLKKYKILKTFNSYVKIPKDVNIPPESTAIHGITREKCDSSGREMSEILNEFYKDYHTANILVAHNYKFDTSLLNIEFQRNKEHLTECCPFALNLFQTIYMKNVGMDYICTMETSVNLCKIGFPDRMTTSNRGYKWPTLLELYNHLFQKKPENLHDSMMDCLVCLRCVLKMYSSYDMEEAVFQNIVLSIINK